jgi:FkbM family methyltransferase
LTAEHDVDRSWPPHLGGMTKWQLRVLEYFLTRHFAAGQKLVTLETGCGRSTLLFSQHSATHHVFYEQVLDGPGTAADQVRASAGFNSSVTTFVVGPTVKNMLSQDDNSVLDIALIGGLSTHPTPHAEYMAIRHRLRRGSILILRDVHVPTTQLLFSVLFECNAFQLSQKIENTAFFWCAASPEPALHLDAWRGQNYNAFRIEAANKSTYTVGEILPIKLGFDGWLRDLPACFTRGFALNNGRPVAGGQLSLIEFQIDQPVGSALQIDLQLACEDPNPYRWMKVEVNGVDKGTMLLGAACPSDLHFETTLDETKKLELKFHHGIHTPSDPTAPANDAKNQAIPTGYAISVRSLTIQVPAEDAQAAVIPRVARMEGGVVSFDVSGQVLNFFVHDRHDSIQAHHSAGHLYEAEELELIAKHLAPGARVLDIGANIGNHTVWFEKFGKASSIVPLEPQPRIIKHLKLNCLLNGLKTVDLSYLGLALGKSDAQGTITIEDAFNPAGAVIALDPAGEIPIRHGDTIFNNHTFDFVKIDTEGAELDVIEGLSKMIARCQPTMFVEVANENQERFIALVETLGYDIVAEYRRYDIATNYVVQSKNVSVQKTNVFSPPGLAGLANLLPLFLRRPRP